MAPSAMEAAQRLAKNGVIDDHLSEDDDQLVVLGRPRPARKYKSMKLIMRKAMKVELLVDDYDDHDSGETKEGDGGKEGGVDVYSNLGCERCGSGDKEDQILICDKCDKGFHMMCLRPVVVQVPRGTWHCPNCFKLRKPRIKRTIKPLIQSEKHTNN